MSGEQNLDQRRAQKQAGNAELLKGDHWELPSDLELLTAVDDELQARLVAAGWSEDEAIDMMLAVHEALINAIAHGNLGLQSVPGKSLPQLAIEKYAAEGSGKKVKMDLDITPQRVRIVIEDEGQGFDWRAMEAAQGDVLDGYGRGTKHFIAPVFNYERNEKGNRITLTKEKPKG